MTRATLRDTLIFVAALFLGASLGALKAYADRANGTPSTSERIIGQIAEDQPINP